LTYLGDSLSQLSKEILEGSYPGLTPEAWLAQTYSPEQLRADKDNFLKIQTAYKACLKEAAIAEAGVGPLVQVLDHISKLYPAEGATSGNGTIKPKNNRTKRGEATTLGKVLLFFQQLGIPALQLTLPAQVQTKPVRSVRLPKPYSKLIGMYQSEPYIEISPQSTFTLPKVQAYNNTGNVVALKSVVGKLFTSLHPGHLSPEKANALAEDVVVFEIAVGEAYLLSSATSDVDVSGNISYQT
jgi:hypothetical protein